MTVVGGSGDTEVRYCAKHEQKCINAIRTKSVKLDYGNGI